MRKDNPEETREFQEKAEKLVKFFKFFRLHVDPNVNYIIDFERVGSKMDYDKYRKIFNRLERIIEKFGIDGERFLKFCVLKRNIMSPVEILKRENFLAYANYLKINEQYREIYENYMSSANYVAEKCMEMKISPKEYIKHIITNGKIGYEYFFGNLSGHYIASFSNFRKLFRHFDQFSKNELCTIFNVCDKLKQEVQESFIKYKNQKVSPLALAERILKEKQNKN